MLSLVSKAIFAAGCMTLLVTQATALPGVSRTASSTSIAASSSATSSSASVTATTTISDASLTATATATGESAVTVEETGVASLSDDDSSFTYLNAPVGIETYAAL